MSCQSLPFLPGKVDESSTLRVSSFHLGVLESCHVTQLPFAEIAAAAVARGVLLPLIATIEKRLKGGCGKQYKIVAMARGVLLPLIATIEKRLKGGCGREWVNVVKCNIAVVARGVCSLSSPPSKKGLKVGVVGSG